MKQYLKALGVVNTDTLGEIRKKRGEINISRYLDLLKENSKNYRENVFHRDGSITINHNQSQNKIYNNNWLLNMTLIELKELSYLLSHMSRDNRFNAIIENDHIEYWSFINFLLYKQRNIDYWIKSHFPLFSFLDSQIVQEIKPQYSDTTNRQFQNEILHEHHSYFPAVWTGFAYLEGLCRRICSNYVDIDGKVIKAFKVEKIQYRTTRGNRLVTLGRRKGKNKISNLHHLLELTRRQVNPSTRNTLSKFYRDFSSKQIFDWRNDCLHGAEDRSTTIIVIFCLISILLLDIIEKAN